MGQGRLGSLSVSYGRNAGKIWSVNSAHLAPPLCKALKRRRFPLKACQPSLAILFGFLYICTYTSTRFILTYVFLYSVPVLLKKKKQTLQFSFSFFSPFFLISHDAFDHTHVFCYSKNLFYSPKKNPFLNKFLRLHPKSDA